LFNWLVSMSFVVLAGGLIFIAVRLTTTLNKIDHILAEVKGVTDEIEIFKKGIKMGLVTLISGLVSRISTKPQKEVKSDE
jgi:uncharacterized protein YoxC